MNASKQVIGSFGEETAERYLLAKKYKVLDKNIRNRYGEIDIIGNKGNTIHFIEVKTRRGKSFGKPFESIDYHKLRHQFSVIKSYIAKKKLFSYQYSFDAISIVISYSLDVLSIDHYVNIYQFD